MVKTASSRLDSLSDLEGGFIRDLFWGNEPKIEDLPDIYTKTPLSKKNKTNSSSNQNNYKTTS